MRWVCLYIWMCSSVACFAQWQPTKASEFDATPDVLSIVETVCKFNFESRKCEVQYNRTLLFSETGQLLSEIREYPEKPSEKSLLKYDVKGRLLALYKTPSYHLKKVYEEKEDTILVTETLGKVTKNVAHILKNGSYVNTVMKVNNILDCKIDYQYTGNEMTGKTVQYYEADSISGILEQHYYKNGKSTYFKKVNSATDSKTCRFNYTDTGNLLLFEETIKPGMEVVVSKDYTYKMEGNYWVAKSEELFSVPTNNTSLSHKQTHNFYFRKLIFKDGTSIGNDRIKRKFVNGLIE